MVGEEAPLYLVDLGHVGHRDDFLQLGEFVDAGQRIDQLGVQHLSIITVS